MHPRVQFGVRGRVRLVCALILTWLCLLRPGAALTLATYNLENYTLADRMVDGVFRPAYPKPEKQRAALVAVIQGIAPDVLAIQEVGGRRYLEDFQAELAEAGQRFPHLAIVASADPDRQVAVLSRWPFKEVRPHSDVALTYQGRRDRVKRGVLEVTLATHAGDLSIFVVHLKSKHTDQPDDPESAQRRFLEAEAVRDLVLARLPDPSVGRFVVCGDWNDSRDSRTVRALLRRGATEIGKILPAVDSRDETWTHYFRRQDSYSRFDYVLVSPALLPAVVSGGARIWDGPGTREASDHRPVVVELDLRPSP